MNLWFLTFVLSGPSLSLSTRLFLSSCTKSAKSLLFWGENLRLLHETEDDVAYCPPFLQGIGSTVAQYLKTLNDHDKSLTRIYEGSNLDELRKGCYTLANSPLCDYDFGQPYVANNDCIDKTLGVFLTIVEMCSNDDLITKGDVICHGFNHESKTVDNPTIFCKDAKYKKYAPAGSAEFINLESYTREDCIAIAENYNVCMSVGVVDLKISSDVCLSTSWGGYCKVHPKEDDQFRNVCEDVVVPAIMWTGLENTHLQVFLLNEDYEEYCKGLARDYTVWLIRRRADAEKKVTSAKNIMLSTNVLTDHLNKKVIQPLYESTGTEIDELNLVKKIITFLIDYGEQQVVRLRGEAQAHVQAEHDLAVRNDDADEIERDKVPEPEYLNQDFLYATTDFITTYDNFAESLEHYSTICPQLHSYKPELDRWGRPSFASIRGYQQQNKAGIEALQDPLAKARLIESGMKDLSSTDSLSYEKIIDAQSQFVIYARADVYIKGAELKIPVLKKTLSMIDDISETLVHSLDEVVNSVRIWFDLYTKPDNITRLTAISFESVLKGIKAQQELLNAHWPPKIVQSR